MKQGFLIICASSLLLLSGCQRLVNWTMRNLYQGGDISGCNERPFCYVRSVTVYDQFTTLAMFDALYLSDKVRTDYVNMQAFRYGKSNEQRWASLRRHLEENKHFIEFIVLSMYDERLTGSAPMWAITLEINGNGQLIAPVERKMIKLDPEYSSFFSQVLTPFKTAYLVKFNARDINNVPLLNSTTQTLSLIFRSVNREANLTWCLYDLCNIDALPRISQDERDHALQPRSIEVQ